MTFPRAMPRVDTRAEAVALGGGLDLISPPGYAKPGTCRFALNYEAEFGGGYRRVGGIERFDGRPSPHLAGYAVLQADGGITGMAAGDAVTGSVSGATGVACVVEAQRVVLTKISGIFQIGDHLMVAAVDRGTVTDDEPVFDGFADNEYAHQAAGVYRSDILQPPGDGPVRGVAALGSTIYAWRGDAGALKLYRAAGAGWTLVPFYQEVAFTAGSAAYADGSTITQGGNSATVKRAVVESGDWGAGTAAGRLIVDPVSGTLAAGAAAGGGACTLSGAPTQITLSSGGRVQTTTYNFTASLSTARLYGCDGVNREFEFDGDVLVPLATGMGAVRSQAVACHKNHLFFLYNGSLQHAGIGDPYKWSPIFGAGELGTGDVGTGLVTVAGSESSAALMVTCANSIWVLYGDSSADWRFQRIADDAGAQQYAVLPFAGAPVAFDKTFVRYTPTTAFGNFSYESQSRQVDPLVRGGTVKASILVKDRSMVRFFLADGLFVTGTYQGGSWAWMPCDYGRTVECAWAGEVAGEFRVFYGGADGWVYEGDVGRSFDGDEVAAMMRLSSQSQGGNATLKSYRSLELESQTESAFALAVAAEFSDSDPDAAGVSTGSMSDFRRVYGAGLFWDFESWDRAYWDVALANRVRYRVKGVGRSISVLVRSAAANEMPHTIKSMTLLYTPRRLAR